MDHATNRHVIKTQNDFDETNNMQESTVNPTAQVGSSSNPRVSVSARLFWKFRVFDHKKKKIQKSAHRIKSLREISED